MTIGDALSFVFDDEEWLNRLLIGALISIIPIFGGFAVTGYAIAVLRNVEAGSSRPLPRWDGLGEFFVDGLFYWIATLVYSIPLFVVMVPIALVAVLPAISADNQDLTTVLSGVAVVVSAGLGCLAFVYGLFLWIITPVLQIRYAKTGQLGACFHIGEVFRFLTGHIGALVLAQLATWAAGLVASAVVGGIVSVLSLIPICGWIVAAILGLAMIPMGFWLLLFSAHLYGQIARETEPATLIV